MKEKLAIMLIGFTVLFVYLLTPDIAKANSEISIETKSGGYQYKVVMGQKPFTWEIGHKGSVLVIEESVNNLDRLENFRNSVEDIKIQRFKVGFLCLLLVRYRNGTCYCKEKEERNRERIFTNYHGTCGNCIILWSDRIFRIESFIKGCRILLFRVNSKMIEYELHLEKKSRYRFR